MINENDYLKSHRKMNEKEKQNYLEQVTAWTDKTYPELEALADSWIKVPVKDFDEGCRLCSAIMKARPFLKVAQRYEAKRAINIINIYLTEVREASGLSKKETRHSNDKKNYRAVVPDKGMPQEDGTMRRREYVEEEIDGRRPEHLNQYLYMLPDELKKKTLQLPDMYLALAEFRGRLEVLSENPHATDEQRAEFARKSVEQEQKIRALWAEVDAAVERYNGRGVEQTDADYFPNDKRPGEYTRKEIESMTDERRKDFCRKKRIELNKKYIRRTDVKQTDEYKDQLRLRVTELMEWEEALPEKAKELCDSLGIYIKGLNAEPSRTVAERKPESPKKGMKMFSTDD